MVRLWKAACKGCFFHPYDKISYTSYSFRTPFFHNRIRKALLTHFEIKGNENTGLGYACAKIFVAK